MNKINIVSLEFYACTFSPILQLVNQWSCWSRTCCRMCCLTYGLYSTLGAYLQRCEQWQKYHWKPWRKPNLAPIFRVTKLPWRGQRIVLVASMIWKGSSHPLAGWVSNWTFDFCRTQDCIKMWYLKKTQDEISGNTEYHPFWVFLFGKKCI